MSEKDFLDIKDLSHLEQLDKLLESRLQPSVSAQSNWNKLIGTVALLLIAFGGYMFLELNSKASKQEVGWCLQKGEYLRIEYFDSQRLKEAFTEPKRAEFLLRDMNEHRLNELGYSMTPRGVSKNEENQ